MLMTIKGPERHVLESLLPWHAAGTLSRREAIRVEQALAEDRDLAREYAAVREELAETIHLNESLGTPSPRALEKLFATIDAEETRAPRRPQPFAMTTGIAQFLSGFTPRTLAWAASLAVLAIVVEAIVIATVIMKEEVAPNGARLASIDNRGSFAVVRFAPQATAAEITNFLGAYKASLVEGPLKTGGSLFRLRLTESNLPPGDTEKLIRQMRGESRIVSFVAAAD
jgi:anti-sigma factor RsiW